MSGNPGSLPLQVEIKLRVTNLKNSKQNFKTIIESSLIVNTVIFKTNILTCGYSCSNHAEDVFTCVDINYNYNIINRLVLLVKVNGSTMVTNTG